MTCWCPTASPAPSRPSERTSMRIVIDRSARVLAGGTVVIGGRPVRLLRLTPAGGRLVYAWRDGAAVDRTPSSQRLAQRLIAAGLAHPRLDGPGPWTTDDVAVVIPARDRLTLLARCLSSIGPARERVVVDDGSRDPGAIGAIATAADAIVVRHQRPPVRRRRATPGRRPRRHR